jgi:hypothetical protein
MLKEYHNSYPDKPGLPYQLGVWMRATEEDQFVENHIDDNRPIANA